MEKILQELKSHLNSMSQEELAKDWELLKEKSRNCNSPTVEEFLVMQERCDNYRFKFDKEYYNNNKSLSKSQAFVIYCPL